MDSTSDGFEERHETLSSKKIPTDALKSLCGVTPHSCRYCREYFALNFSDQDIGTKATENQERAELEPAFDNSLGEYRYLNVAYEDLEVGSEMGCPLCAQWSTYITENDILNDEFAPRFSQGLTWTGFHMCPSFKEDEKLHYSITVPHESPFAPKIWRRPFDETPGSCYSLSKARDWLQNCRHLHDLCQPLTSLLRPRHLIHISKTPAGYTLKLLETIHLFSPEYAALSYCWGDEQDSLVRTTTATLQAHRTSIDFHVLPRTIQDAVAVISALRVPYLWCDSLCIVQDDVGQMHKEISSMGWLLGPRVIPGWNPSTVINLPGLAESGKPGWLTLSPQFEKLPEPLDSRAWALQERTLSSRVLSFGQYETRWICRQCDESDIIFGNLDDSDGDYTAESIWRGRSRYDREQESRISHFITGEQLHLAKANSRSASLWNFQEEEDHVDIATEAHEEWQIMVTEYTGRKLTNAEDRLPAIAGIASKCQSIIGCRYFAGLWETHMFKELLWRVSTSVAGVLPRPSNYHAPSWSWASTISPVTFSDNVYEELVAHGDFRIDSCEVETAPRESPFGSVVNGCIVLTGRTRIATLYTLKPLYSHHRIFALTFSTGDLEERLLTKVYCDAAESNLPNSAAGAMTVTLLLISGPQDTKQHEMWAGETCRGLCLEETVDGRYRRVGLFETTPNVVENTPSWKRLLERVSLGFSVYYEHKLWLCTGDLKTVTII